MDFLTDTTFLIDLWRERAKAGCAMRFARSHTEAILGLPWVAKGEFLRGALLLGQGVAAETFLARFQTLWPTETTLRAYAEIYGELRGAKAMIGPNDLWIAALAREHGLPLLTRNAHEFERVAGLRVIGYDAPKRDE